MSVGIPCKYLLADFELEPDKCLLQRNGERVHLPELPFQVLLYLIEKRERYVSRQELLDRFWTGSDDYEETLTKCISTIRTQLDDRSTAPRFIETRKKVGYRYIGPVEERDIANSARFELERTREVRIFVEDDTDVVTTVSAADTELRTEVVTSSQVLEIPQRAQPTSNVSARSKRISERAMIVVLSVVVCLVVTGLWFYRHRGKPAPPVPEGIRSIAVLPLDNLSGDPTQEYFADGMTEALINNLAQVRALRVISRASVMHYKGTTQSLPEIARELNVDAVITGSVQREGGRVRVTAQLIQASTDVHVWARDYQRDLTDVLKLESEVARAVADEIQIQVSAQERSRLASARTVNPQAQEDNLLGRYHLNKSNEEDSKRAIEYFERAIQLAPDYAAPYAGLSEAWLERATWENNFKEVETPARAAALKAIEFDEQLAEAHVALAKIKLIYDLEWTTAEQEFKRALELNQGSVDAHTYYGLLLSSLARHNEAIEQGQIASQLDPLSSGSSVLGRILYRARRYQEAVPYLQRGIELEPSSARAYYRLGDTYAKLGRYDEAIDAYRKTGELAPNSGYSQAGTAYVYALMGRGRQARQMIAGLKVDPLAVAEVDAALGDKDEAFRILRKASEEGPLAFFLSEDPAFESLNSDPRWHTLMVRMNLPHE